MIHLQRTPRFPSAYVGSCTSGRSATTLPETLELYHARFQGDRIMSESTIRAAGFFVLGALLSVMGAAQTGAIDPAARECLKGRAAIEDYLRVRLAKSGRAASATATSLGSVQQGDFVYEWGRSEVRFAGGKRITHRYLTVWQRQLGGVWKIFRNMPIPDDAPR